MRFRVLLVALVLCRGLLLLCILPPFEGWDEYQHVAYVQHVRDTGQAPRFGETQVSPALLARVVEFPQPDLALRGQLSALGARNYRAFWIDSNATPATRKIDQPLGLYQAQHSALYYWIAAPLYGILGGASNLRWSVAGLRLVNLLLMAAAVWVTLGAIRRVVSHDRHAALIGLVIAAHPLFLMNGTRVSNDALGILLAASAISALLGPRELSASRSSMLHGLATGLLVGLAILAKATNFALVPLTLAWLGVLQIRSDSPRRRSILVGLALGLGVLAVAGPEIALNLSRYGSPTPMQEAIVNRQAGRTGLDLVRAATSMEWAGWLQRLWDRQLFFVGGWSFRAPGVEVLAYKGMVDLGLLGWLWIIGGRLLARRARATPAFIAMWPPMAALILVLSYSLALGYHRVQSQLAWGSASTCPWYAAAALPWFLALIVVGASSLPFGRFVGAAVSAGMAGVCIAGELIGAFGRMVPWYTADAEWPLALQRLATLQPFCLGTATLGLAFAGEVLVLALMVLTWRERTFRLGSVSDERTSLPSIRLDRVGGMDRIAPRFPRSHRLLGLLRRDSARQG